MCRQEQARRTFSIDAVNEFENVVEDIYDFSEQQEPDIETLSHEDGIAQLEVNFLFAAWRPDEAGRPGVYLQKNVNFLHGDPMRLSDQVFTFKRTVREAAFKQDMYATFMAKPHQHQPGSSMHLHQSIINKNTGKNIFASNSGRPNKPLESSAHERAITLPRDLHSALKLMRRCAPVRRLLGEEFIQVYNAVKKLEYETFFQVISSWEREHLLFNV